MTQTAESLPRIPDKQYFRIGEVSRIVGVPTYVLRFWETEFPRIKPKRTAAGQRLYHRRDLPLIIQIKTLLHDRQFTIKGARQYLKAQSSPPPSLEGQTPQKDKHAPMKVGPGPSPQGAELVEFIQAELRQIRDLLK